MNDSLIQAIYLVGTLLFIFGLKNVCSPVKSHSGLLLTGFGLLVTVIATYFYSQVLSNFIWISVAVITGGLIAFVLTKNASIADVPKMTALYSGMGAGAAAIIAAIGLSKLGATTPIAMTDTFKYIAVAGVLLGGLSFSGALITFARLQGLLKNPMHFPMHQWLNALLLVVAVTFGFAIIVNGEQFELSSLIILVILALVLGMFTALPIASSDMPIALSFIVALTGLSVGLSGYTIGIPAMMIAGTLVAAGCLVLTQQMAKSKNRSIAKVLFGESNFAYDNKDLIHEKLKEVSPEDASIQMAFAKKVIVVPGYGMAISQAQNKLIELSKHLNNKGVVVKFAIHPAAGRIPGHMNLLLADAGIPNDDIYDLEEINDDFASTDVVLIIGGNDIANTSARTDEQSPVFGMHILNADQAKQVIVIKRGDGLGYSNIENPLFYKENTSMLYGDAQTVLAKILSNIKSL